MSEGLPEDERRSPLVSQLVLWIGFALVLLASILTVLVPELTSEGEEDGGEAAETEAADGDSPASSAAPADPAPTAPAP